MIDKNYIHLSNYSIDQSVYRYMSLEKFIYMISNAFIFPRITLFNDIFEGTYPYKYYEKCRAYHRCIMKSFEINIDKLEFDPNLHEIAMKWRNNYFVSCWHANDYESEAMWRLYSNYNKGMAIKSSIKKLIDCFPEKYDNLGFLNVIFLGEVKYIDFRKDGEELFKPGRPTELCLIKRKSFEYEKEIRMYTHIAAGWGKEPDIIGDNITFKIDYNRLIDEIIIAPNSPKWYYDTIKSVCDKYEINVALKNSEIGGEPVIRFFGNEFF